MENGVSRECEILLQLLAHSLFGAEDEIDFSGIELNKLFAEAKAQTVLALAFDALPAEMRDQDAEAYERWRYLSFSIIQKNIKQMHSNAALENIFAKAELPFCTIKGFASAYYYGEKKHLRQMGDVDFIVPAEKIEESKALLINRGFSYEDDHGTHDFHWSFQKDGELYEMHKGITAFADSTECSQKYIEGIFSGLEKKQFDGVQMTTPTPFFHGFIMLEHMKRHLLTGGGIGLRHLCDWASFVESLEDAEWTSLFEKRLKEAKLWKFAKALSMAARLHLKIGQKQWFADMDNNMAQELLGDILTGGNFGKKSIERYQEIVFLSKPAEKENKILFYSKKVAGKVYSWKSFYRKHKSLLPFGVAAYVVRTFFLVLFRKKKVNLFALHKSGKKRDGLYKELFR